MLPRAIGAAVVMILASALISDCGNGRTSTTAPVELTEGGACGEAFFWAATPDGDLAVTIGIDARDRSGGAPTAIEVSLPDPGINVRILRGTDLPRNLCTDVLDGSSEPESTLTANRGSGEIVLAPPNGCGVDGTLRLDGLVAADGTRFEPVTVTSSSIGCYAG